MPVHLNAVVLHGPCQSASNGTRPAGRAIVDQALRGYLEPMDLTTVIEARPGVRSGKPCFIGTRIAVYDVLDYLAAGMTSQEIVDDFPELSDIHVRAALEFAAQRERRLAAPA